MKLKNVNTSLHLKVLCGVMVYCKLFRVKIPLFQSRSSYYCQELVVILAVFSVLQDVSSCVRAGADRATLINPLVERRAG